MVVNGGTKTRMKWKGKQGVRVGKLSSAIMAKNNYFYLNFAKISG